MCVDLQQRDSSRGRHREKEDIKITKERTPASEEEPTEWETNREGLLAICICLVFNLKFIWGYIDFMISSELKNINMGIFIEKSIEA